MDFKIGYLFHAALPLFEAMLLDYVSQKSSEEKLPDQLPQPTGTVGLQTLKNNQTHKTTTKPKEKKKKKPPSNKQTNKASGMHI